MAAQHLTLQRVCATVLGLGLAIAPLESMGITSVGKVGLNPANAGVNVETVNLTTAGLQEQPAVIRLKSGGHVIAWTSRPGLPGNDTAPGVCTRHYGKGGGAKGDEICWGTDTAALRPALAATADGGYVLVWVVRDDGSGTGIHAQRRQTDGTPIGDVQPVNTMTAGDQAQVAATGLPRGGYAVAWSSPAAGGDIYLRQFNASGHGSGPEQRVNSYRDTSEGRARYQPAIASLGNGGYIVAWVSQYQSGPSNQSVYAQRFDAQGIKAGPEMQLSDTGTSAAEPALSALGDGSILVAWRSDHAVMAQRFGIDGRPLGSAREVDPDARILNPAQCAVHRFQSCEVEQGQPAVAALDDGGYVIAWAAGVTGFANAYVRRFGPDGEPKGQAQPVTSKPGSGAHYRPMVSPASEGGFVAVWERWEQNTLFTLGANDTGIAMARFGLPVSAAAASR